MISKAKQQIKYRWILLLFLVATLSGIILLSAQTFVKTFQTEINISLYKVGIWSHSIKKAACIECLVDPIWIYHMHRWINEKGPYSQGSQDLYLNKIFSVINTTNKYFVEFGFNEKGYETGGSGSNTRKLYEVGWRGLLLDGDNENPTINLKKHYLFANNIAAIFKENKVPQDLDYLSCDMDSHDLWVFRAILQAGYRPRVVTTEYNGNYPITDAITLLDPTIDGNSTYLANFEFTFSQCAWGAGAGAFRILAEAHGYTLVGRVSALDLIWMRNDLLIKGCFYVPPFEWFFRDTLLGGLLHGPQLSPSILSRIIDYRTYVETGGNLTASNIAARTILKTRNLPCYEAVKQFL